ncbi:MAG: SDR family oxidoreductase [Pseudomonadota bacterium]
MTDNSNRTGIRAPHSASPTRRELLAGASAVAAASVATQAVGANEADEKAVNVEGKSILITGASSGFGRLASLHLARNGARIIASMRNFDGGKRPEAQSLADTASDEKLDLSVIEIDVTQPDLVDSGTAKAHKIAGGPLDVLINNAGIAIAGPIEMHDEEALAAHFETNLFGYHRMAKAVLPKMRARGEGYLIHVSSQLGRLILPNIGMYCATKFGLEAMFEAQAYELAPFGVDATIIEPGGYPTQIWDNGKRYFDELVSRTNKAVTEQYGAHLQLAEGLQTTPRTTDPMDVPRAMAALISMPAGARPLRQPVHPNTRATDAANAAMRNVQAAVLGNGPYAKWHAYVAG